MVRLQVRNQGEVPAALLGSLFQPWVSASAPRSGDDNLGLGLYIAERIVTAHGGTLGVITSAAEGTTFTAALPRRTV